MKGFNFIERSRKEESLDKKMFPQMFELTKEEASFVKGGSNGDCDAVCLPSEWGGQCGCHDNVALYPPVPPTPTLP